MTLLHKNPLALSTLLVLGVAVLVLVARVFAAAPPPESPQPAGSKAVANHLVIGDIGVLDSTSSIIYFLNNPDISVSYAATLLNAQTGAIISDGATVPVGTQIRIVPKPHEYTDIFWFGALSIYSIFVDIGGFNPCAGGGCGGPDIAADSPYGDWQNSVPGISCNAKDYVSTAVDSFGLPHKVYVPFTVSIPTKTINTSANLTCGAVQADGSKTCTVASAGPVSISVVFGQSTGAFYLREKPPVSVAGAVVEGACTGGATPSTPFFDTAEGVGSPRYVTLDSQTIPFALSAELPNNPPNAPTIGGPTGTPTAVITNTAYTYTFTATDIDNDAIKYVIDWDNDGAADAWLPASGTVVSGTPQSTSRTWATSGTKTFQALTQDVNGSTSGWTSYTVTVVDQLTASCAPSTSSVVAGTPMNWTVTVGGGTGTNAYTWSGTDTLTGSTNPVSKTYSTTGTKTASVTVTSGSQTLSNVACSSSVTVTAAPQPDLTADAPAFTPAHSFMTVGIPYTFTSTVRNIGQAGASNFPNSFHVNNQPPRIAATPATVTLTSSTGATPTMAISAGSTKTFSNPGTFSVGTCADLDINSNSVITNEISEANNCTYADFLVEPPTPNTNPPTCNADGTSATLAWGPVTGVTGVAGAGYYVNVDKGAAACPSGWTQAPGNSNFCRPTSPAYGSNANSVVFPTTPGASYTWHLTSHGNDAGWSATTSRAINCAGAPDLTADPYVNDTAVVGTPKTLGVVARNTGTANATNFPNIFQIATDPSFTTGEFKVFIGNASIAAGASQSIFSTYTFTSPGTYYIRGCVDNDTSWTGVVPEANVSGTGETNNCGTAGTITVSAAPAPDLTTSTLTPTTGIENTNINFSTVVSNIGTAAATVNFSVGFQYANNAAGTGNKSFNWRTVQSPDIPFAPGATKTVARSLFATSSTPLYVRACADSAGITGGHTIAESNEGNNCTAWTQVVLGILNLTATPGGAKSGPSGSVLSLSGNVVNSGTVSTPIGFSNIIQVCNDASCSSYNQRTAISPDTNALGAGASRALAADVTLPGTPGSYVYRICADNNTSWAGVILETDEGGGTSGSADNCSGWAALTVSAPAPVVSLTSNPTQLKDGDTAVLTWGIISGTATSCTGTGFSTGAGSPTSGSTATIIITPSNNNFSVSCTGPGGTGNASVSVTVRQPVLNVTGTPDLVAVGSQTTIAWSATDVDSCTISGPGLSASGVTGSQPVTINGRSTFTLSCQVAGSTVTKTTVVRTPGSYEEI